MAKQFTLGKNERLKSRKLIEQLFSEGKNLFISPFRIYYHTANNLPNAEQPIQVTTRSNVQFGVGVASKNFKNAVDRNRIKRLIREAYRLQKNELQQALKEKNLQLNIFFVYTMKELTDYKFIYDKMNIALQKIITEVEKQSAK